MARAVGIFKDNAIRIAEVESEKNRLAAQTEQDRKAGLRELASRLEAAVKDIADGVKQSAQRMHDGAATMSGAGERTKVQSSTVAAASEQASANEAAAETDEHARIALENSNELSGQADRLWQAVIGFVEDVKAA